MAEIAPEGLDLYEVLRYILPAAFLAFIAWPFLGPTSWRAATLPGVAATTLFLGLVVHSSGLYRKVPGHGYLRDSFNQRLGEHLRDKEGVTEHRLRFDVLLFAIPPEPRQSYRRNWSLGAIKLDLAALTTLVLSFVALRVLLLTRSWPATAAATCVLFLVAYVLRHDGLKDVRRASNAFLIYISSDVARSFGNWRVTEETRARILPPVPPAATILRDALATAVAGARARLRKRRGRGATEGAAAS